MFMLSVRHDEQVSGIVICCVAVHMVNDFSCLQRPAEVNLCDPAGFFGIWLAALCNATMGIAFFVQLREVLRSVAA